MYLVVLITIPENETVKPRAFLEGALKFYVVCLLLKRNIPKAGYVSVVRSASEIRMELHGVPP